MLQTIDLTIDSYSKKGHGIGTLASKKQVEVAHAVPGDRLQVGWRKQRRSVQKGRLIDIVAASPMRVEPRCVHARTCGGCCWQQMDYAGQLEQKTQWIGAIFAGNTVDPIIPCDRLFGYRNKMEFSFSQNRGGERYLGLMIAQAEPYVFNVSECHLGPPWFAEVLTAVRSWWIATGLDAYYPPQDTGALRHLTLREAFYTKQKMAVLNVSGRPEFAPSREDLASFVKTLQETVGEISIFLRIHMCQKGVPTQFYEMHLAGSDHIVEKMRLGDDLFSFKISPVSFFQPNTTQAEKLYMAALSMLPRPLDLVYDLYAGTGTLGLAASKIAKEVVGIEWSPEAVLDAEANRSLNGIQNYTIHQGDVGKILDAWMQNPDFKRPDAVLIDPPRAGLDAAALMHLKNLMPKSIVYLSCNPKTQGANVKELLDAGYSLKRVQPVDQFPHTYHIENIALLER